MAQIKIMDQIANMVNTIKNGNRVGHEYITVPYSKIKQAIADRLKAEGYIKTVTKKLQKDFLFLKLG